ncbi:MAG: energy transducer TonB [Bacteroidales bacterium]|nr:energy transducer TonB [Bacteroidales bacterium]
MNSRKSPRANLEARKALFFEISLVVVLALVYFTLNAKSFKEHKPVLMQQQIQNLTEEMVPITDPPKQKMPPPKQFIQINLVDNHVTTNDLPDIDVGANDNTLIPDYVPPLPDEKINENHIFIKVEHDPSFPGGEIALMKFLAHHIHYPELAKQTGIQGRVFLRFVVEPSGLIDHVEIIRGIGGGCDEEAIRVIKSMPRWNPGKQMGRPVRVAFSLAVNFRLEQP